jgi:uncharacterized OsmC-like protein
MTITATIANEKQSNEITVSTNNNPKSLLIPAKPDGTGSSVNGGELLFLALATCYCNDVYREAAKMNIAVRSVEVTVSGKFGGVGEPGSDITYSVNIESDASAEELSAFIDHVDQIAEVHNTLRKGVAVRLVR